MMRSTFSLVVSTPESMRISSSTRMVRFCASSTISSTLRPAAYCSMRKLLRVLMSSPLRILKGENPNCTSTACRKSMAETWVWLICATTTSAGTSFRNDSMSVVLPEPISPVITTKPSVNQMVDSMYALARACCFERYRNCGSGLKRNGNSLSLKGSRYIDVGSQPMLRDANAHPQILEQRPSAGVAGRRARLDHRTVAHLASRAGPLAVVVKVQARDRQQPCPRRLLSDQIHHGAEAAGAGRAERQAENGTQVILELAGGRPLDGPVTGVVHARCHLVGDQPAATHEKLDGENAAVAKVAEHALEVVRGAALPAWRPVRCPGEPQDPGTVHVAAERVDADLTAHTARADDRHLAVERHPLLVEERHVTELGPGTLGVCFRADDGLPLTVVAEAACLQHTRHADGGERPLELAA